MVARGHVHSVAALPFSQLAFASKAFTDLAPALPRAVVSEVTVDARGWQYVVFITSKHDLVTFFL
jgi:hypothetical protein